MTIVLRKGHGPFSSGTIVNLIDRSGGTATVEAYLTKTTTHRNIAYGFTSEDSKSELVQLEIPTRDLVELRSRSELVPVKNKKVRREEKKRAMAVINQIKTGEAVT